MGIGFEPADSDRVGERQYRKTRRNGGRDTDGGESMSRSWAEHGGGVWLSPPCTVVAG